MKKAFQTLIQSAKTLLHIDTHERVMRRRFIIHSLVLRWLIILLFVWSLQERIIAVWVVVVIISYIPFMAIELYHRPRHRQRYRYGWIAITALWVLSGMINLHYMINALWSAWLLTIWRRVWDYCNVIRRWKMWNIYNQVATIGVFVISIGFGILSMRRFQSINFSCNNINFLSTQFFAQMNTAEPDSPQASLMSQVVVSGGRSSYLELIDAKLKTDWSNSLSNTIKQQVRNWVIVVMDQKQLYDKSVCDYVTTALNDNYQKPSFFYSWVLLLTFIGLAPARIALIIIASVFSLILWVLYRLGIYRSHATLIEHQVLE